MSYLTVPRLVFSGQFQADVSTVNNDPAHFDTARFQPNYDLLSGADGFAQQKENLGHQGGWWNPRGTGAWRLANCSVRSVTYRDGTTAALQQLDPVIGLSINGARTKVEGKLVDLDPEQQMVSEIWGLQVFVGDPLAQLGFGGSFEVSAFADLWARFPAGQPDSMFGAIWQSVLSDLKFANGAQSRFVNELLETKPDQLSIKFNVDGIDQDFTSPTFTFGRLVGAIGLQSPVEPKRFVLGRALATAPSQSFGTAYAKLSGSMLYLDLGNSLPTTSTGGPIASQGCLSAVLQAPSGPKNLGSIAYEDPSWYETTAGIVALQLSTDDAELSKRSPLTIINAQGALLGDGNSTPQAPVAQFVRADRYVYRMNPGDKQSGSCTVDFYATAFGEPLPNAAISLALDPSLMQGFVNQGVAVSGPNVGTPTSAVSWPAEGTRTDASGHASITLTSHDPGNPRVYIDGQVYGITYGLGSTPPAIGSVQNPSQILNLLVFSAFQVPERPNWLEHVQPIFQQYANLYPIMRPIVDLANFASVTGKRVALQRVFSRPESDPNYMPVTRDLSAPKRAMLLKWLARPEYMNLDSVEDVKRALEVAVELEHATIPAYLTALYSIKPGRNVEVAQLLRSVVMQEMLHMTLAANILIAIGGSPRIGRPGFMPAYPAALPGGLRADLTVRLRKCSIEQIRDCFLSIEEPARTSVEYGEGVKQPDSVETHRYTIAWFYDEILAALEALGPKVRFDPESKQVIDLGAFQIRSLSDARRAIKEVIRQGEGASPFDPDDVRRHGELAHYYKFSEIVQGRRIVIEPGGFSYTGECVPFEPDGVYPMMDDPDLAAYPTGSRAQVLAMQFAQTYQRLLRALNVAFNGQPETIADAIGLMFSLGLAAQQLMQTPSGVREGCTAGPVFQLPIPGLHS